MLSIQVVTKAGISVINQWLGKDLNKKLDFQSFIKWHDEK